MPETKISATHRLQREQRWGPASRYRERRRQELRSMGVSRKLARDQAWAEMIQEFPSLNDSFVVPATAVEAIETASMPPKGEMFDAPYEIAMAGCWWIAMHAVALKLISKTMDDSASMAGEIRNQMVERAPSVCIRYQSQCALRRPRWFFKHLDNKIAMLRFRSSLLDVHNKDVERIIRILTGVLCQLRQSTRNCDQSTL